MTANFHNPLPAKQQAVAIELQGTLVDLLDLSLIGKHAHWNVERRMFRSVHHELDELVEAGRMLSDDVAERAVTIGASPDGKPRRPREPRSSSRFPPPNSATDRCSGGLASALLTRPSARAGVSRVSPRTIRLPATYWSGSPQRWRGSCG